MILEQEERKKIQDRKIAVNRSQGNILSKYIQLHVQNYSVSSSMFQRLSV